MEVRDQVARLVEKAQVDGIQLTGEGGLLPDMIKQAVEAALQGEMTAHLGYERYAAEGRGSGNSRNGTTGKTARTAAGAVEIAVTAGPGRHHRTGHRAEGRSGSPSSTTW